MLGNCTLAELTKRKSYKWRYYPADVLPAFVAEMDFTQAEPISEAIRQALAIGDTGYAHVGELGEAYASFAAGRLGWTPRTDWIFPVPDVMTGIAEVLGAATPHGSGVVISPPVYGPFFFRLEFAGRKVVQAPLHLAADGSYQLDLEVLDRALATPGVSSYLLCSPHNPLGKVWTREELLAIAEACLRHDVVLAVDEIHSPLLLPGAEFVPFGSLDHEMAARAYVFTSASKGWNIAGLKCGVGVAGSAQAAELLTQRWESLLASHLGVLATVAAFTEALDWLDAVNAQIAANHALLADLLAAELPEIRYVPGTASFLAWLDCRKLGLGDDPSAAFLQHGKVALSPGTYFGPQGAGYARLNIGTSPELLTEAVRRMAAGVALAQG
jgi:cysteine-S-conjugate beta-lyase